MTRTVTINNFKVETILDGAIKELGILTTYGKCNEKKAIKEVKTKFGENAIVSHTQEQPKHCILF